MDLSSSLRKKLKFNFSYRESKDPSDFSLYSPVNDSNKYTDSTIKRPYSPRASFTQLHSPQTNLIEEIMFQCRRIDPEFSVNADNSDYNSAAMQTVRKAVDMHSKKPAKRLGVKDF